MNPFQKHQPTSWAPFIVCTEGEKPPYLRALSTNEGLGDRLRFVAFAEKQASVAFATAALVFPEVSDGVKKIWNALSLEEGKHLQWLLWRIKELGIQVDDRPVSNALWRSFDHCLDAPHFAKFMASSEEHGRIAGEKFYKTLLSIDPVTARIFNQIAIEETQHIKLAQAIIDLNFNVPADFDTRLDVLPLDGYSKTTQVLVI